MAEHRKYEDRWLDVASTQVLDALKARAAPAPFCLLLQFRMDLTASTARMGLGYLHALGSPAGPKLLRTIRARSQKRLGCLVSFAQLAQLLEQEFPIIHDRFEARRAARIARIDGVLARKLTATGQPDDDEGQPNEPALFVPIPYERWQQPDISLAQDHLAWRESMGPGVAGRSFSNVRFETAEVTAAWPAARRGAASSDGDGELPQGRNQRKRETSEKKLVYDEAACRIWFKMRVNRWPDDKPPPNGDQCLADARAHFGGHIARDPFREIRRGIVPAEWQKTGPRARRPR